MFSLLLLGQTSGGGQITFDRIYALFDQLELPLTLTLSPMGRGI
jgi:hypothetical protein